MPNWSWTDRCWADIPAKGFARFLGKGWSGLWVSLGFGESFVVISIIRRRRMVMHPSQPPCFICFCFHNSWQKQLILILTTTAYVKGSLETLSCKWSSRTDKIDLLVLEVRMCLPWVKVGNLIWKRLRELPGMMWTFLMFYLVVIIHRCTHWQNSLTQTLVLHI